MSRLGINIIEFYGMTPAELHYSLSDQAERESLSIEIQQKAIWESARMQMYHEQLMNPYLKKKPGKVTDVMKFSWEAEKEEEQISSMKKALEQIHVAAFLDNHKKNPHRPRKSRKLGKINAN